MEAAYNIVVLGDKGVGKHSLISQYTRNRFGEQLSSNGEAITRIHVEVNVSHYRLDISTFSGCEKQNTIRDDFVRNGHGYIIMYDITSISSFKSACKLLRKIPTISKSKRAIMFIGTKSDKALEREVTTEAGEKVAKKLKCGFMEVSTNSGINIRNIFDELVVRIDRKQEREQRKLERKCFIPIIQRSHGKRSHA